MSKKVLITGVSGMDGSLMVDYLLANTDYLIFGMVRRSSNPDYKNFKHNINNPRFKMVIGDLSDSQSIDNLVREIKPDYFLNFAGQTFVGSSWALPEQTVDVTGVGVLRCLEAVRKHVPNCRFYSAGSSEEVGDVLYSPQDLNHPIRPRSPYGSAKAFARHITKVYRESYNLFAIHSILFNHEMAGRRSHEFVTRKISLGVARIDFCLKNKLPFAPIELGNIDAKRDWSDARDFMRAVWMMMNQKEPKEYILSSNETHTVREFIELAFKEIGVEAHWHGKGLNEEYSIANYLAEEYDVRSSVLVKINPKFFRPADVEILHGNSDPARQELGWIPEYSFKDLVKSMVQSDISNYKPDNA